MGAAPTVLEEKLTFHSPDRAATEWDGLTRNYPQFAQMREGLAALLGTTSVDADGEPFGLAGETKLSGLVHPPKGMTEGGAGVDTVKSSFIIRSFTEGDQQLAMAATVIRGEPAGLEIVDAFALRTTTADFLSSVKEYVPGQKGLEIRDGWWDALTGCLGRSCGGVCLSAAISCPKINWAAFLVCLAGRCGTCVVKCAACATCNCSWWCKWAAGCCDH